jgi:hypothetical protein
MPGNPLVRFDEGRVGRTRKVSPSLLLYCSSVAKCVIQFPAGLFSRKAPPCAGWGRPANPGDAWTSPGPLTPRAGEPQPTPP